MPLQTKHRLCRLNGPPWVGQNTDTSKLYPLDCGIADACALIQSKPGGKYKWVTPDHLGVAAGVVTRYQGASTWDIQRAAGLFGVSLVWQANVTVQDLIHEIEDGRAGILLIRKGATGARYNHFVVGPHGYEWEGDTLYFYYDDPEPVNREDGENVRVPAAQLLSMMQQAVARTPRQMLRLTSHRVPFWKRE